MKNAITHLLIVGLASVALLGARAQEITVGKEINVLGLTKPIPVALSGFTGVGAEVLRFDLTVQGFSFVAPEAAQYLISGTDAGSIAGSLTDKVANRSLFSRTYSGGSLRRQAHALADDIVQAVTGRKGIGQTKIAFKCQPTGYGAGEIYVSDFDGDNAQAVTSDKAIVAKPAWVPGRLALYYTSYARGNPDIFYHDLSNGQRRIIAGYSGLNTSAAVSPDGSKIAMVLDKTGTVNIWVCDADGSHLKRITQGVEDSSPTWSPDGQWICFATKENSRRRLAKVASTGGALHYINTAGVANPSEPDWSPDGKWIAFTSQMGNFNICVVPADSSQPPSILVSGQNPSWAPNSRTLAYNHSVGYREVLSVLDVFTKQYKDCKRVPGSSSQPAWAR
jgi:TolB protein